MLTRFTPFELHTGVAVSPLLREFDQVLRELATPNRRDNGVRAFVPAADVYETEAGFTFHVDLPGHDAKDIQVKVEKDVLTIHSERKPEQEKEGVKGRRLERGFGVYERSFVLPQTVDSTRVEARYDNGVLTLHIPRREEAKPRVIEVKVQ